jgi:hypothetical protein
MLEKQSRDPLGWYHCENSSHKNRQDRHLIEINSPHRMMRQRLGEPSLDSLPFVDGLPKSVRICLKGFESVKNGLCRALSNSDATLEDKASLLASLLSALGKAHRPEIVDKLEKRASMASVNARTANSTTITVPSFVEAVITDVLLTPRIRMEIEVWDRAMKVVGGRPDDLGAVMTAARLKNASKPTAHNSSDIGSCFCFESLYCKVLIHLYNISLAYSVSSRSHLVVPGKPRLHGQLRKAAVRIYNVVSRK